MVAGETPSGGARGQPGNVVQAARTALTGLPGAQEMTLAIGFGGTVDAAQATARASLDAGFAPAAQRYAAEWGAYLGSLKAPPRSVAGAEARRVYDQSLLVLAASEDKLNRGASIAAPNMP